MRKSIKENDTPNMDFEKQLKGALRRKHVNEILMNYFALHTHQLHEVFLFATKGKECL